MAAALTKIAGRSGGITPTLIAMKLMPLSRANALAIIVLEQPGGPYMRRPRGGRIPRRLNASGCLRGHSIAWRNLCFKSACPPMSSHNTWEKNGILILQKNGIGKYMTRRSVGQLVFTGSYSA